MNHKGYTILELLVVLLIISAIATISFTKYSDYDLNHLYFINDYLYFQTKALCYKDDLAYQKGITFNDRGHVNMARTIDLNDHLIVIHLGSGYLTYE